jgi:hypothetical protein
VQLLQSPRPTFSGDAEDLHSERCRSVTEEPRSRGPILQSEASQEEGQRLLTELHGFLRSPGRHDNRFPPVRFRGSRHAAWTAEREVNFSISVFRTASRFGTARYTCPIFQRRLEQTRMQGQAARGKTMTKESGSVLKSGGSLDQLEMMKSAHALQKQHAP